MRRALITGGVLGFFLPGTFFGFLWLATLFHIEMGRYFVGQVLVFGVHLLEMPVVILGRSQGWPIEKGGAAFIIFDLSTVGYSLVFLGWKLMGILVGGLIGLTRKMISRSRNPAEENRAGEAI